MRSGAAYAYQVSTVGPEGTVSPPSAIAVGRWRDAGVPAAPDGLDAANRLIVRNDGYLGYDSRGFAAYLGVPAVGVSTPEIIFIWVALPAPFTLSTPIRAVR